MSPPQPSRRDEHLPEAAAVGRPDDAAVLHLVEDAGRPRVADAQATLEQRCRCLVGATHDVHRLREQRIGVVVLVVLARPAALLAAAARGRDLGAILRSALRAPMARDRLDLGVGDEDALEPRGAWRVDRLVEHVTAPEQVLRADGVEDRARVDAGGHREGDAARDVGLDEAGDDLDRWALGGHDEVDARGAGELRDAGDRGLDLVGGDHHQVGELVDDDDDVRHPRLAGRSASL